MEEKDAEDKRGDQQVQGHVHRVLQLDLDSFQDFLVVVNRE